MVIDLFCEDRAHEAFLKPLISRIGVEKGCDLRVRVRIARGGRPRVMREFRNYQRVAPVVSNADADVVVVAIDGNCLGFAEARADVQKLAIPTFADRLVVASPDPHIERWYMADPQAVSKVLGREAPDLKRKCERAYYKRALRDLIARSGRMPLLGGPETAPDLAENVNVYRAGRNDSSFKAFVSDLKAKLARRLASKPKDQHGGRRSARGRATPGPK